MPYPANVLPAKLRRWKTPFLVFDREVLRKKAAEFTGFRPKIETFYSVKANSSPTLLEYLAVLNLGFEVSSKEELRRVLAIRQATSNVSTSNPIKPPEFIDYAYRNGIDEFVVDSVEEIYKIASIAPGSKIIVRLLVDNTESAWPLDKKYGVSTEEAVKLLVLCHDKGLRPLGLTFHVGSQCTGYSSWLRAMSEAAFVWKNALSNDISLEVLNVGGGFPAHHIPDVPATKQLLQAIASHATELFPSSITLRVEPGRGLVADAGWLVTSIIGKAVREGQDWMYLDVGIFNGLMEAIGGIEYQFSPVDPSESHQQSPWVLAGPTCDSFDVVSRKTILPDVTVGDRLTIFPGGAYTTCYASRFNGVSIPQTHLV